MMIHITESIPIPLLIVAICVLMLYPYIGAGILLAVICAGAGYYWLAAASFAVCIALHFIMRKHIKPVRGVVAPAKGGRKRKRKKGDKHLAGSNAETSSGETPKKEAAQAGQNSE